MTKEIVFHHGALADPYEFQANEQGYTFGEEIYNAGYRQGRQDGYREGVSDGKDRDSKGQS